MKKYVAFFVLLLLFGVFSVYATNPQINVTMREYVTRNVTYGPNSLALVAIENQTIFNITGVINITNVNQNYTLDDIWVYVGNVSNITSFIWNSSSRNSTIYGADDPNYCIEGTNICYNNTQLSASEFNNSLYHQNSIWIHVPELKPNQSSVWDYQLNNTEIVNSSLDMNTNYSNNKALTGTSFGVTQSLENVFFFHKPYADSCVYKINITLHTLNYSWVNSKGQTVNYTFYFNTSYYSLQNGNFSVDNSSNRTWYWYTNDTFCFPLGSTSNLTYKILVPETVPISDYYIFETEYLKYESHGLLSGAHVLDVKAVSEANKINLSKQIAKEQSVSVPGGNVTWNVTGSFSTPTDILFNLTKVTVWVAVRNDTTGPNINEISKDTVNSNITLERNYTWQGVRYYNASGSVVLNTSYKLNTSNALINSTNPWIMAKDPWLFNYTIPEYGSPVVFIKPFYTIYNDNGQNISYSNYSEGKGQIQVYYRVFNSTDQYNLQIYVVVGYFLRIMKNITLVNGTNDTYRIVIKVHNAGNQYTPIGLPIMVYDFVPTQFTVLTNLSDVGNSSIYMQSEMYNLSYFNRSVTGQYNGSVEVFKLTPNSSTSGALAPGQEDVNWTDPDDSFWVNYTIKGYGQYNIRDVYITGLDPMAIEGAGESARSIITDSVMLLKYNELPFAVVIVALFLGMFIFYGLVGSNKRGNRRI